MGDYYRGFPKGILGVLTLNPKPYTIEAFKGILEG